MSIQGAGLIHRAPQELEVDGGQLGNRHVWESRFRQRSHKVAEHIVQRPRCSENPMKMRAVHHHEVGCLVMADCLDCRTGIAGNRDEQAAREGCPKSILPTPATEPRADVMDCPTSASACSRNSQPCGGHHCDLRATPRRGADGLRQEWAAEAKRKGALRRNHRKSRFGTDPQRQRSSLLPSGLQTRTPPRATETSIRGGVASVCSTP